MLLEQAFVETTLSTEFAKFKIRVYENTSGKEPFVLWTQNLDATQSVLVRVHSECITGDMLKSLHCDCGEQLTQSLQLIGEKGGVLIYLRQEGRGIGLFEKIKSYQLQAQGHDTFEANVLLGHPPDTRSYEIVKLILNDLGISRIKLLTNNPSKISDIAKFGITITERVPIISKETEHNKTYIETKREKFHHLSKTSQHHYFYQCHVDITPAQLTELIEFVKPKNNDPLLRICIGTNINQESIKNQREIEKINSINQYCAESSLFIPVLHYSFMHSSNILEDSIKIRQTFPAIARLQLNDLSCLEVPILQDICNLFSINIPLSDANFEIVHKNQFRELVKHTKSLIMLDNSKGKGVKESVHSFMRKIDILLNYGLNDIALCGGFGPDELDTYFKIREYYRFNFSIDASTNLKTEGKLDLNKIKRYLLQLIRFESEK